MGRHQGQLEDAPVGAAQVQRMLGQVRRHRLQRRRQRSRAQQLACAAGRRWGTALPEL